MRTAARGFSAQAAAPLLLRVSLARPRIALCPVLAHASRSAPPSQRPAKKRKVERGGASGARSDGGESEGGGARSDAGNSSGGEGKLGTAAKAFQRVKADEWLGKKGSWDNSYVGTFGENGWGFKAQQILGQVRAAAWVGRALRGTCLSLCGAVRCWCCGPVRQGGGRGLVGAPRGHGCPCRPAAGAGQGLPAREDQEEARLVQGRAD